MTARRRAIAPAPSRRSLLVRVFILAAVIAGLTIAPAITLAPAEAATVFGQATPRLVTDPDTASVELGLRFSSSKDGTVTGIRYYRGPQNAGPHTATLWDAAGRRLATATFATESGTGWQTVSFAKPVAISAGTSYVASYLAPKGHYSADVDFFNRAKNYGSITVPAGGGVYAYGAGGFPTQNYRNSNYYVDVVFQAGAGSSQTPSPTPSATSSPTPTRTPAPPQTPTPTPSSTAVPGQPTASALDLPRIPWEGGPAYWKQFSRADAAGWDDPNFFPIVVWYNSIMTDPEVVYDKSLGVNTYIGMWEGTPYDLWKDNDVFWIGDKLNNTFSQTSANWVGDFLDDEVDGRFTPAAGQARLQSIVDRLGDDGRFKYANFTQMVVGPDMGRTDQRRYVNDYTDVVSLDQYWYTIPYCSWTPFRGDGYLTPIAKSSCRTASSYGKMVDSLRAQDATDGKLQPVWQFVENLNGGSADVASVYITPGQLKGAVMNSIINEARGIVYFNQSLNGSCQSGSVFRDSQNIKNFCGAPQVAAAKQVDAQIHDLASVINTQSYEYSFGSGLDTMLKVEDGQAYVFAMIDGSSKPGARTFQLPAGVKGTSVEVLDENRSIPVDGAGRFTDSFAAEYSYHIYRVALG